MRLRNSRTQLSVARLRRIGTKRHRIKRRKAHANFPTRRNAPNSLHNFAQKSRAILKTSPVLPFPRMRAKKFMPQISMAMFHIDKIKTQFRSHAPSAMEILDDAFDFPIREHWKIGSQTKPPIQNRMPIQNLRLRPRMRIRFAVPPRMRKLQTNKQSVIGTRRKFVLCNKRSAKLREPGKSMLRNHKLIRIRSPRVRDGDGLAPPN